MFQVPLHSRTSSTIKQYQSLKYKYNYFFAGDVIIGKKSQELCMCIVGIRSETSIDILNKGHGWIICSITLNQIQGDSDAIELLLPSDVLLVEPNDRKVLNVRHRNYTLSI